jgi:sugar phosphate isomerase/epimerase
MFKNLCPAVLGVSGRESEIIELALSHGFKGLDLDLVEFCGQVETQGLAKASRLIQSARLKLGSFPLPVRWQDDSPDYRTDMERLPALADVAREIGCRRATTLIEPGSERVYHENFEFHRRRLAELGDALAQHEIRLGVGFLAPPVCRAEHAYQFVQTAEEVLLLLRNVSSSNVGVALDTWHWHLGGGTIEQLRSLGADKFVAVSLADAEAGLTAADADLAARRLPAEGGAVDNAAVLTALAEMRYDGPVTPAADKSQFAGQGRDQIVKRAAAAFDGVWKAAGLNASGRLSTVGGR